jgi:hypothetical protein
MDSILRKLHYLVEAVAFINKINGTFSMNLKHAFEVDFQYYFDLKT